MGVHVTPNHFYEPIPDLRSLPDNVFDRQSELVGVDMREEEQLKLLEQATTFREEYSSFPLEDPGGQPPSYYYNNGQFGPVDAEMLHVMVRLYRPRRIMEIGSGFSTLVALGAIEAARAEDPSYACEVTCIEPNPRPFLRELPGVNRLVAGRVEEQPLELFAELEENDILFIDSSHILKIGGDVQFEFLEVLPRVAPGVLVQVHDIFFPTDYPRAFVKLWKLFFAEQYLLQGFLQFNETFQVRWCGSWMAIRHPERLRAAFPSYGTVPNWTSSLWMQRVAS
jgi:predicted O-methyltransferase YrrM